jgi:glycosyltransferase involved in cell wall biosynthesis
MSRNIKICILSELAYPLLTRQNNHGGAELQMIILAKELVKRSYDVSFVTFNKSMKSNEIIEGIKVYNPFDSKNRGFTYLNPKNLYKLLKILKKINADIYIQRATTPLTGVVSFFAKLKNKIFLYSVSSDYDVSTNLSFKSLKDLKNIFFRFGIKNCNLVLCQTNYQKKLLNQTLNKSGRVIKNFFPLTTIEQKSKDSSIIKILWVGRIIKDKKPDIFLTLAECFPDYKFLMIGFPSALHPEYYYEIKESAKKINNLDFIGIVPHDEVHKYYEKSHLFIHTSENEGFPNTFLEAWGNAIPIVSLNFDPDEIICKYKLGFHSMTFDDLVKHTGQLLKNESLRNNMGINAQNYVLKEHNVNNIIDEYKRIINNIIDIKKL